MAETTRPPAKKATAPRQPKDTAPADKWAELTADFPADWIEKLPKTLRAKDDDKGTCTAGGRYSADGYGCGKYHARAVHLDYVGHAGITMRLNSVLGPGGWDFQPMAWTADNLPVISRDAFWAKLTVTVGDETVTKWELAANFSSPQEALGDALRRCAMRLGIGTYLWSKSDQALERAKAEDDRPEPEPERPRNDPPPRQEDAPHIASTLAVIKGLTQEERDNIVPWWDAEAGKGHLPARENVAALTPSQAIWIEEVVSNLRARLAEGASTAPAAQDPS